MAAESEQADESGVLPEPDLSPATADADKAKNADGAGDVDSAAGSDEPVEPVDSAETSEAPESSESSEAEDVRPEDVREGVVDLVAYAVGAAALILLGYFTQRDVLTWTRGPFTVVVIIMAVHWAGRRVQARRVHARRDKVGGAR